MTQLDRALHEQIVAAIRAGGFPYVAAQAFGVAPRLFDRWRRRGRSKSGDENLRSFARVIDKAIAQARLRTEMDVFTAQPRIWLQHGPGRETGESPGWTVAIKPNATAKIEGNPFMMPGVMGLFQRLMNALDGHAPLQERVAHLFGRSPPSH